MKNDATPAHRPAPTRRIGRVPVKELWPHGLLSELLDPPAEETVQELAEVMQAGRQPPGLIEVEPDHGQVLIGMPLVEAARRTGLTHLEAVTRLDMAGMTYWQKELELIDLHLQHGDLNPFGKVRCLARAHAIRDKVPAASRRPYQEGKLNDVVARWLGMSHRNAARYVSLADLPPQIGQLFEKGQLHIELAEKVARLPDATVEAIAAAIAKGDNDPAAVVAAHLRPKRQRPKPLITKVADFVTRLKGALEGLPEWGDQAVALTAGHQEVLRQVRDKADRLLAGCRTIDEAKQRAKCEALLGLRGGRASPTTPPPASDIPGDNGASPQSDG